MIGRYPRRFQFDRCCCIMSLLLLSRIVHSKQADRSLPDMLVTQNSSKSLISSDAPSGIEAIIIHSMHSCAFDQLAKQSNGVDQPSAMRSEGVLFIFIFSTRILLDWKARRATDGTGRTLIASAIEGVRVCNSASASSETYSSTIDTP